jgi:hypothetical protein
VLGDDESDLIVYWDGEKHEVSTSCGGHALLHVLETSSAQIAALDAQVAAFQRQVATATATMADPHVRAAEQFAALKAVLAG